MRNRFAAIIPVLALTAVGTAQTAFTYQGRVKDGAQVASGPYDLRFRLFDASIGGNQVGTTQCANDIAVTEGVFTTTIDFGQQFATTASRFLEIEARADTGLGCGDPTGFVVLAPRQLLTAAPKAAQALTAFGLSAPDGSPANALIVNNAGNIGIGTTNPGGQLHIANELPFMVLQDTGLAVTQTGYLSFQNSSTETGWVGYGTAGSPHMSMFNARLGGNIGLFNENGERFTLVPSGNVGIGTNTPQVRLDVRGSVALGTSGELRAPGSPENLRIIRGTVNISGVRIAGTGFTSSRPGVGDYTIVFDAPFTVRPTVTATCEFVSGFAGRIAHTDVVGTGTLNIVVTNGSGSLADAEFNFIAIGPR